MHSRISNSGDQDLSRYIGSSSLKRRQFIEDRSYIFMLADNDVVYLQGLFFLSQGWAFYRKDGSSFEMLPLSFIPKILYLSNYIYFWASIIYGNLRQLLGILKELVFIKFYD